MSIASQTDLVTKVGQWLFGRSDLAPLVPDFVTLFEAKMNRVLQSRHMEARAVTTLDTTQAAPQYVALPADFVSMRRVRLLDNTGNVIPDVPSRLTFMTGTQMDDHADKNSGAPAGPPEFFTLFGNEMELWPAPDQDYQIEMVYRQLLPPLASNSTNWLLQLAPDAYLYGCLMEAAPYLMDDDRIAVWKGGVDQAVQQLNDVSEDALYNAGPLVMRSRRRGY